MPDWFGRLPTMLTEEELRMLSFLARNLATDGDILDLGCFVGGSTLALAHGVRSSDRPDRQIHSFDLFQLNEALKYRFLYARGLPLFPGTDGLPLFEILTSSFSDIVTAHPGNVLETLTPESPQLDRPVALLFLDLCKSTSITDHITRTVFPRLRPGTWIVQQDFIYEFTPWAIYPFWVLQPYVKLAGYASSYSAIFQVVEPIPTAEIEKACVSQVATGGLDACLGEVREWFPYRQQRDVLDAARRNLAEFPDARDEWAMMKAWRQKNNSFDPLDEWRKLDWS
jgi:hypothetical protein